MNTQIIIKQAWLEEHSALMDICIGCDGKIAKIAPSLSVSDAVCIEAEGALASPPFVDPHTHLDKAFFQPTQNISGTLNEAFEIMRQNTALFHQDDDLAKRANAALELEFSKGTLAVRTHIDIDTVSGAGGIEQMLRVKEAWKDRVEVQIVAFPQEGLAGKPQILKSMRSAMEMGADALGGIPCIENCEQDMREHIDRVFELAGEYDKDIDMHIDETDDPNACNLEMLATQTIAAGWTGRVSAAHCCALSRYDDEYADKVIERVAEAKINIISNPTVNMVLQGRHDKQPQPRGITRVKELLTAGINVASGQDNMQDIFYPFGQGNMLEVGFVLALTAQLTGKDEIETVFRMIRHNGAKVMALPNYGIQEGYPATFILLPVKSALEAIALRPACSLIVKNGRILSRKGN